MTKIEPASASSKWRVEVSPACISAGVCLALAPDHFELVGVRARPITGLIDSTEDVALIRDAEDDCPVGAISVIKE
ncbi:hypothetical protein GCM10023350_21760 [Nocardioides endophyticus]|uniref:Ferredoxin n=1 Tax=Nocardioides endophyticus TaxID=1353775 RepID=A0ABP8YTS2_9ACTN